MELKEIQKNLLAKNLEDLYEKDLENTLRLKNLYLFSVNHKTAPVAIREKFSIPEYSLSEALNHFRIYNSIDSYLILSTCNRTEIYFTAINLKEAQKDIYSFFAKYKDIEEKVVNEYCTLLCSNEIVNYLVRVSCGLESLVIGEKQILSQVKASYAMAQKEKTLCNLLELLFQSAIKCSKEVHKSTNISKSSQSISSAAIELANKVAGPLNTKNIMVLGAGKMAELALEHIIKLGGSKETSVLNRSPHRVISFSDKYKINNSFPFEGVYTSMNEADIIIAATGAPHFILFAEQFKEQRKDLNKPLFVFDISMPRNVDSEFGKLPNVTLYDIDSLQTIYSNISNKSNEEIKKAENIISSKLDNFYNNFSQKNADDFIKVLKEKIEKNRLTKLEKLIKNKDSFTKEEVDYITKNIINTIFHPLMKNLKSHEKNKSQDNIFEALKDLF